MKMMLNENERMREEKKKRQTCLCTGGAVGEWDLGLFTIWRCVSQDPGCQTGCETHCGHVLVLVTKVFCAVVLDLGHKNVMCSGGKILVFSIVSVEDQLDFCLIDQSKPSLSHTSFKSYSFCSLYQFLGHQPHWRLC